MFGSDAVEEEVDADVEERGRETVDENGEGESDGDDEDDEEEGGDDKEGCVLKNGECCPI